ncbi:MAG TPA: hydrogenase small subunit [Candidatus Aveggerthella stercoripullorum]|jgi:hydrogenase small subunit|uniref:Hydrogenase small subunit n=1 Tax=Candidatus Aveggerthella stercoripullorum TaxID=2840688 RepID=A0A9D1A107_9ACTN|nr:hydrogenase small subunit [Candidatus Aveggerthella stercoripullorum]
MEHEATASQLQAMLEARGVSRRSFMKMCGAVAVAAGLSELAAPRVAQALEESVIGATEGNLYPVIWIEGASCTGCTEAFAQIDEPDPATVVLEMISLNYSETLSAAAGWSMEEAKEQTIEAGNYLLVYEGAVLEGWNGQALRVADKPGIDHLIEAAENANAVVALGSCAVNGGWMGAHPNPAGAIGVQKCLEDAGISTPVINVPGCPANPEWLVALLVDVVLLQLSPADIPLTRENKPELIFGQTIHDNCQRRGHFENGEFVYQFGSEEEKKGYCLYPVGCRGPQTYANCGIVRYNHRRSWCVESGAPCIGCCEAAPMDPGHNWVEVNTPFFKRHRDLRIGDWMVQPGTIALTITGVLAAALVVHGFGMKMAGRAPKGAEFEKIRKWDAKHPDRSIGQYDQEVWDEVNNDTKKGGQA